MDIRKKPSRYLGFPADWGKSKKQALHSLKERIKQKLKGWKTQFLSQASKEILLKVFISSMPTYMMSCLRFPNGWCNNINNLMARFWWGQKEEEKKIHWVNWKNMIELKDVGGMGFKDLYDHNLALLTKTAWRSFKTPNALWARVLKGLHFPKNDFLEARRGSR